MTDIEKCCYNKCTLPGGQCAHLVHVPPKDHFRCNHSGRLYTQFMDTSWCTEYVSKTTLPKEAK